MSWSISFTARSKTEAHAKLIAEREGNENIPEQVGVALAAAVDAMPDDTGVAVSSYGHVDSQRGGNGNFSMNVATWIAPVETAPAETGGADDNSSDD